MTVFRAGVAMLGLPAGRTALLGRAVLGRSELGGSELGFGAAVLGAVVGAGAEPERTLVADTLVVTVPVGSERGFGGWLTVAVRGFGRAFAREVVGGGLILPAGLGLLRDERYGTHVGRVVRERGAGDLGSTTGDGWLVVSGVGFFL